jgi:hypothetical protein
MGPPDTPVVAGIMEPGVTVPGEVWEPVQPASAIAQQRITSAVIFMLNCIPENAIRCYIMFLPGRVNHSGKKEMGVFFLIIRYSYIQTRRLPFIRKRICRNLNCGGKNG